MSKDAPGDKGLYGKPIAFSRRRMLATRVVALVALAAGAYYLEWRLSTLAGTGHLGRAFYAAETFNYLGLILAVFLFWEARWRPGPPAPPAGTLDIFIPVCGEPVELVERTLRAALAIEYPHRTYLLNDGRVAGKRNWQDVEELAGRYGVPCFTRASGAPGKGPNFNHALARTDGEFVATIDADHRAHPDLAHETLGYFSSADVALVSSPQEFDGDEVDVLNNRELLFYRFMAAAKDADNAVQAYGNAVYRRAALESVGGFSEWLRLCEDLHTSYRLHAQGWKSVYHPRALTTGLAPQTASALAKQRLVWATDSLRVFFQDNPLLKHGLTLRQRLHYLQSTGHYVFTTTQLLFVAGPALWLLFRVPTMRPKTLEGYLTHMLPFMCAMFGFLFLYGSFRGGLRVVQANVYLAPVHLVGLVRALAGARYRATVTEKVRPTRFSPLLLPQLAALGLNLAAIGVALSTDVVAESLVAGWAAFMVFMLAGFVTSVGERPRLAAALRTGLRAAAVLAVAALLVPRGGSPTPVVAPSPEPAAPSPALALVPPARGAYVGVTSPELLSSAHAVADWNGEHGVEARIAHWYQQWLSGESRFRTDWLEMVKSQGAVPMISWEPWAKPEGSVHDPDQPDVRLAVIASGRYDAYVREWARAAAAYKGPLLLRPMHLMNGDWYPWSVRTNGNSEADFVAAWRHIHDLFVEEGATNVSWVWAVNSFAGLQGASPAVAGYYPGDEYVNWVSMAGFNWGDSYGWNAWRSVDGVFLETYGTLAGFGKPIMISEIGTAAGGGDPAAWVRDALARLEEAYPLVQALVWFDSPYSDEIDFRLSGASAAAFEAAVAGGSGYWRAALSTVPAPAGG